MFRLLKSQIKFFILQRRFSNSKIHYGVSIDNNSKLGKHSVVFSNTVLINSNLDDYSYIQKNSEIVNTNIGKFCSIASNVTIGLANHPMDLLSTSPVFYDDTQPLPFFFTDTKYENELSSKTIINSDVWIGQGAMIKSGVTIGVGSVIGAAAVVTKDVEPYSIVAGIPAKHVKYRFEKEVREELVASNWWNFDDSRLEKLAPYFKSLEILLEKIKDINEI